VQEITAYQHGTIVVVEASGELDMSNVDDLNEALRAALLDETASCLLDTSGVEFADSSVVHALIRWSNDAQLSSREALAIVVSRDAPVARLLELVGLTTKLPIFASREAATTALLEGQRARDQRQLEWLTDAELHTARTDAQAASDAAERRLDAITAEEHRRDDDTA
jgi:anti-anti-sigma factor